MRKSRLKIIKYAAGAFILLVALPLGLIYIAACRVPADYQPLRSRMNQGQLDEAANRFVNHMSEFQVSTQSPRPFTWSVTQRELNMYLASMDEISWTRFGGKRGRVVSQMEKLSLEGWCVSVREGLVKLMVRSTKYDKVLSAALSFKFVDGKMQVELDRARVGGLVFPKSTMVNRLSKLRDALIRRESTRSKDYLGAFLLGVLEMAVENEPREPVVAWDGHFKPTLIERIDISGGKVTIHARPVWQEARVRPRPAAPRG